MIVEWNDRALASVERQTKMTQSARGDARTKHTPRRVQSGYIYGHVHK